MSRLEQLIYRDAARAAAEITAADVPPLRLERLGGRSSGRHGARKHGADRRDTQWTGASAGRGATRGRRVARGTAARRVLAPIAASACVIALIVVLVVAGRHSSGPSRPAHRPQPQAAPSRADRLLATEALDWYFPDSGATYTAGLAFGWTQDKITDRDIDRCLAAATYPQPPFRGSKQLYQMSFPSQQFPDLAQLAAHPGQHYFTGQYPVIRHSTPARVKAFTRVQARCTARYAKPVTRVDKAAGALQTSWYNIIAGIEASPRVSATQPAFARCLEAHGVPASDATQTTKAGNPLFYGFDVWGDSLTQSATSSAQLAAEQRHESRVFIACARPVVTLIERIQIPRRAQFFREHAAQIRRIVQLAQEVGSRSAG